MAGHKLCPECGKENTENANFCENCGTSLKTIGLDKDTLDNAIQTDTFTDNSNQMGSLNLTPAESLMILDHEKYSHRTSLRELLKVTLMDLVFKNVFKVDVQEFEEGGREVKKIYLYEGENFNIPLKAHEEIFQEVYSEGDNLFETFQWSVLRNALKQGYAKEKLLKSLSSDGFFTIKKSLLRKKYVLSDKGVETKQIIQHLKDDGKNLEKWLETDPERAKAYMLIGGSNVFLTDKRNFKWFKNNSGRINSLFSNRRVHTDTSDFFDYYWYPTTAFILGSEIMDIGGIDDLFSDFNMSDIFDSVDAGDFDFGFNSSESDFGGSDSGFDSGGFDSGGSDGGGGGD